MTRVQCANCGAKMNSFEWQLHRCRAAATDDEILAGCVRADINAIHLHGVCSTKVHDVAWAMVTPEFVAEYVGASARDIADIALDLARIEVNKD